jgi:hypothetical protein
MATVLNTITGSVLMLVAIVQIGYTVYNLIAYKPANNTVYYFQLFYLVAGLLLAYGGYKITRIPYFPGGVYGGRR